MFASKPGRVAAGKPIAFFARLAACSAMLGAAGCASQQNQYSADAAPVAPAKVAQADRSAFAEDDGRPAQALPSPRIRELPDEPAEPFSPNYGGKNPSASKSAAMTAPVVPAASTRPPATTAVLPGDLPSAFRKKLVAAMAADE